MLREQNTYLSMSCSQGLTSSVTWIWYYPFYVIDTPCYLHLHVAVLYSTSYDNYIGIAMFTILYSLHLYTVHVWCRNYALVLISYWKYKTAFRKHIHINLSNITRVSVIFFATPTMVPITEINTNMRVQTTSCVVASRRLFRCFFVGGFTSLFVTLIEVTGSALWVVAYHKERQPCVHRLPLS